jgi:dipeptidyl aminopeptidase/acylaminoacyl peptidase
MSNRFRSGRARKAPAIWIVRLGACRLARSLRWWRCRSTWLALLALPMIGHAAPLEVYGRLPGLEEVSLSPSGSRIAFVTTDQNTRVIRVISLTDRKSLGGLRVGEAKLRDVSWADEDHLLITTSATGMPWGLMGEPHEWYMLQVFDVLKHRSVATPAIGDRSLQTMNVTAGRVMVRRIAGHTVLFVPGIYVADRTLPMLVRYDLDTGTQFVYRQGSESTDQWLVDADGEIVAEQDYGNQNQKWAIKIRRGGHLEVVASGQEAIDYPQVLGFGSADDTLLVEKTEAGDPVWRLMSTKDGTLGPPMAEHMKLDEPIEDRLTYRMIGGVHVEDDAHYVFFDPSIQHRWDATVKAFDGEHVQLESASAGFRRIVVRVDGKRFGYQYQLVDFDTDRAEPVGDIYAGLTQPLEVRRITYAAADGMQIPAYLTLPQGREPKNLPLIVLPHGGPAVRDTADFDWWSQALANEGYAVLRPNYRGSTLNERFLQAGFGQWGRKMQTDLSDGVRFLVKEGIADPGRVCIVGASYGGYAALAGVTVDPGVYRCAVSVAGLADLKRMLNWVNAKNWSSKNLEQRYWDRFMGVTGPGDPVLSQISPIDHIDAINVPVLLIHGHDDTVVPFEQSEVMFKALRRAQKSVDLVVLDHEDHWLSRGETRLQMLKSTVAFLRAHNPPEM